MAIKLEFAREGKEPATSLTRVSDFLSALGSVKRFYRAREGVEEKLAEFLDDS